MLDKDISVGSNAWLKGSPEQRKSLPNPALELAMSDDRSSRIARGIRVARDWLAGKGIPENVGNDVIANTLARIEQQDADGSSLPWGRVLRVEYSREKSRQHFLDAYLTWQKKATARLGRSSIQATDADDLIQNVYVRVERYLERLTDEVLLKGRPVRHWEAFMGRTLDRLIADVGRPPKQKESSGDLSHIENRDTLAEARETWLSIRRSLLSDILSWLMAKRNNPRSRNSVDDVVAWIELGADSIAAAKRRIVDEGGDPHDQDEVKKRAHGIRSRVSRLTRWIRCRWPDAFFDVNDHELGLSAQRFAEACGPAIRPPFVMHPEIWEVARTRTNELRKYSGLEFWTAVVRRYRDEVNWCRELDSDGINWDEA